MSRQLLLALIGGTLGESFDALPSDRDLSSVEDSVVNFLIQQLFLDLLNATWPVPERMTLSIAARGAPKVVCNLPVNELIVAATITLTGPFGPQPLFMFLPRKGILERLIRPTIEAAAISAADRKLIELLVREMPVDISVILGSAQVSLTQLAALRTGDVVVLGQKVTDPLKAKVGGSDKFEVWPGVVGRRQAVQIDSTVV